MRAFHRFKFTALAACCVALLACSPATVENTSGSSDSVIESAVIDSPEEWLIGVWTVSLYFDPAQPPSATVMEIITVNEGAVTGSFYGTSFETARIVEFENEIRLSFVTSDGSGPYTSAARLLPDGTLSGQTLSTGRDFLMPWTAQKE